MPLTAATAARPPIANIANFVVKTDNLDEARRSYGGDLGYDEVFRHKRAVSGPAELSVFKVNERQYIEVSPNFQNRSDDQLIQIGGRYPLPTKAGLGVEINEEALKRYPFQGTRPFAMAFQEDGAVASI